MKSLFIKIVFITLISIAAGMLFVGCSDGDDSEKYNDSDGGYFVRYVAEEGGYIDGEDIQAVKVGESGKAVTAVPNAGYVFSAWSDGVETAERVETAVTENTTLTAKFEKNKYSIKYFADDNGTIRGKAEQTATYGEYSEYVTAVPDEGYEFYKWSDGVMTAERRESDVKSDITVTAKFKMKLYKLYYRVDDEASGGGKVNGATYQMCRYGETGSTVTAVPNEGYEFCGWSDGVTTAKRKDENIGNDINVYAVFAKKTYKVIYRTSYDFYGLLHMENGASDTQRIEQSMSRGESVTVTAKAGKNLKGENFIFLGWSDGVTTAERTDIITDNLNVTAYFGYEIDYSVNNGVGGRIEGKTEQKLYPDEVGETVTAVPNDGYVFCGWSDFSFEPTRPGDYLSLSAMSNAFTVCEYMAYFEPITKTFAYSYGDVVTQTETEITLNRNDIKSAEFVVPSRDGYVFCGWYADDDYSMRITDETGRYMYGYATFSLESDTLYARWRKADEEYDPHKILLIFIDEICANIESYKDGKIYSVHTKMAGVDYQICKWITQRVTEELTECLSDKVKVEVDAYYTTDVVSNPIAGEFDYGAIFANQILEVALFANKYHNTISYFNYGDYRDLYKAAGTARFKNACVYRGSLLWNDARSKIMPRIMRQLVVGSDELIGMISTSMHEFSHMAEVACDDVYDFHTAMSHVYPAGTTSQIEGIKKYLRGELMIDGEACGIPSEYWEHTTLVTVGYGAIPVDYRNAGKVRLVEGKFYNSVGGIRYGSSITVEAVPLDGYRFVMWTDGVTTAVRHDSNIIAHTGASAIFEKIT